MRVGELADRLTLPHRPLQKHFGKIADISCKTWLDRQRLSEAKKALLAGKNLREAAADCGYRSANALTKVFRRLEGKSFRDWRNELQSRPSPELSPEERPDRP